MDIKQLFGNTAGLKPSQIRQLVNLYNRRVRPWQLVSPELARRLGELARDICRQVGVLLDRRGYVRWVMVGSSRRLLLPDVGRLRAGRAHLRGLRLIHVHLDDEELSRDDLTDLALLRLDYVAAVCVDKQGLPGRIYGAHLVPGDESARPWRLESFTSVHELELDPLALVEVLEEEFARTSASSPVDAGGERAVLVVVAERSAAGEERLHELRQLAHTASLEVVGEVLQVRPAADPRFVVGRGRLQELIVETMQKGAELVVFGNDLTPAQARAIADATELKVIDRTQLILDIFARRARSRDGKLQVELAQLRYRLPRLTREDSGLSRLTGGIGGRGPGETKLEIDRRRARERITRLEGEIERLSRRRALRRARRQHNRVPVLSIVGYTNAGKSTLLNTLTDSQVFVEDRLFATLDPTTRRLRFPREREVVITDTVGFIRDLPADLLAAFRATLEELEHADLLLHVADASDSRCQEQTETVLQLLRQLGLGDIPRLLVLNKCDRLNDGRGPDLARRLNGVLVSATQRLGLERLLQEVRVLLWDRPAWDS